MPFVIIIVATVASLRYVRSGVPVDLYMSAGPEGSQFYQDGLRFKEHLAEFGINVHVQVTLGSAENLRNLISDARPTVGFVEAGLERETPTGAVDQLVSLGSLYVEPAWLFFRKDAGITDINSLAGKRVVVGIQGSGARSLAELLIEGHGINKEIVRAPFDHLSPAAALKAMESGEIDAMFATGPPNGPIVSKLLHSELVRPMSFRRASAYARHYEYLAEVNLPEGSVDLGRNIPGEELKLVSLATNLIVPSDLHPSAIDLLLEAIHEIYGNATLFTAAGEFPNGSHTSRPLHPAAKRFFNEGPSPVRRLVPFWLASLFDRFSVVMATLATTSIAFFSVIPRLLAARFNMSLLLLYKQLGTIEVRSQSTEDKTELLAATDKLLSNSSQLRPPANQVSRFLEFRQALHDVRERLTNE